MSLFIIFGYVFRSILPVVILFQFQDVLTDQYLRIFSLGITAFIILFGLAQSGQAIEDVVRVSRFTISNS